MRLLSGSGGGTTGITTTEMSTSAGDTARGVPAGDVIVTEVIDDGGSFGPLDGPPGLALIEATGRFFDYVANTLTLDDCLHGDVIDVSATLARAERDPLR